MSWPVGLKFLPAKLELYEKVSSSAALWYKYTSAARSSGKRDTEGKLTLAVNVHPLENKYFISPAIPNSKVLNISISEVTSVLHTS